MPHLNPGDEKLLHDSFPESIGVELSRPKKGPLLSRVPHQQTATQTTFVSLETLPTRNAVYPGSQSPNAKPILGLLTPNKVDYVAPDNQKFSICLFLILYPIRLFALHSTLRFSKR